MEHSQPNNNPLYDIWHCRQAASSCLAGCAASVHQIDTMLSRIVSRIGMAMMSEKAAWCVRGPMMLSGTDRSWHLPPTPSASMQTPRQQARHRPSPPRACSPPTQGCSLTHRNMTSPWPIRWVHFSKGQLSCNSRMLTRALQYDPSLAYQVGSG